MVKNLFPELNLEYLKKIAQRWINHYEKWGVHFEQITLYRHASDYTGGSNQTKFAVVFDISHYQRKPEINADYFESEKFQDQITVEQDPYENFIADTGYYGAAGDKDKFIHGDFGNVYGPPAQSDREEWMKHWKFIPKHEDLVLSQSVRIDEGSVSLYSFNMTSPYQISGKQILDQTNVSLQKLLEYMQQGLQAKTEFGDRVYNIDDYANGPPMSTRREAGREHTLNEMRKSRGQPVENIDPPSSYPDKWKGISLTVPRDEKKQQELKEKIERLYFEMTDFAKFHDTLDFDDDVFDELDRHARIKAEKERLEKEPRLTDTEDQRLDACQPVMNAIIAWLNGETGSPAAKDHLLPEGSRFRSVRFNSVTETEQKAAEKKFDTIKEFWSVVETELDRFYDVFKPRYDSAEPQSDYLDIAESVLHDIGSEYIKPSDFGDIFKHLEDPTTLHRIKYKLAQKMFKRLATPKLYNATPETKNYQKFIALLKNL